MTVPVVPRKKIRVRLKHNNSCGRFGVKIIPVGLNTLLNVKKYRVVSTESVHGRHVKLRCNGPDV